MAAVISTWVFMVPRGCLLNILDDPLTFPLQHPISPLVHKKYQMWWKNRKLNEYIHAPRRMKPFHPNCSCLAWQSSKPCFITWWALWTALPSLQNSKAVMSNTAVNAGTIFSVWLKELHNNSGILRCTNFFSIHYSNHVVISHVLSFDALMAYFWNLKLELVTSIFHDTEMTKKLSLNKTNHTERCLVEFRGQTADDCIQNGIISIVTDILPYELNNKS